MRRVLEAVLIALVLALIGLPLLESGLQSIQAQSKDPKNDADRPLAFRGSVIHTASGPVIPKGTLIIHKGKIIAVGSIDEVKIPADAIVRDVAGKVIIPGLVDTHSHVGIFPRPSSPAHQDGNETTGPVQPGLRAIDSIHPQDPGIKMALSGGVTTAHIMPGSANAIGGQTLTVKFKGTILEMMRLLARQILGGIKFANGENPKGAYGSKGAAPATRMKIAALQREQLAKAQSYKRQWDTYRKKAETDPKAAPPERDLAMEPLVEVLERKRTVHFHCHRADDIMTAVRLSKEFGFELVLQHCTEGYRIAEELAKEGIWVSLTLLDSPGGKPETLGLLEENAAILHKAGVKVAINTDDFITESRFFLRSGSIAVRGGMPEDAALKALTLHGAQMLHVDDRVGSLEAKKDADFVILSGAPFSVYTQVLETWIDGEKVFDRSIQEDWAYQAGGFALADKTPLPKRAEPTSPPTAVKMPEMPKDSKEWTAGTKTFAVFAGRVHTVAKGTIEDGVVLVEDGLIKEVGKRGDVKLPAGIAVLRAAEVTPGLIDAHTSVGLSGILNDKKADQDQDERSDPNQSDLRVLDSFNPQEPLLQFVREQGVTVIHATPGPANVIGGQTGVFRTHGRTAEQMTLKFPAGIFVNLGENPKSTYAGKFPSTRMGTANLLRTAFAGAQAHARKRETAKEPPAPNFKHEALELALNKKVPVWFAAHRGSDITTALRIADEFQLRPVLALGTEAYLVADILVDKKLPIVAHPTMQRPSSLEAFNSQLGNAAALTEKKLTTAIGTAFEGYVPKTRVLRQEAAMAMVNGLGFDGALKSITSEPAKILGIDDRFGALQPGKVADLVLYDGNPFEHATHVTHTILGGRVIFDRSETLKMPLERRMLPLVGGGDFGCCLGNW